MKDLENVKDLNGNAANGSFIIIMGNNGKINAKVQIFIEKLLKGIVHQKYYFCQHLITLMFVEH